ncbi:unnamed protein product [Protopolystoma xenopodis]|uniref:Uncharacterized protein n=1 Tax=Protopolystoma xenopodis TaxID=117903 RepID=A0A3S5CUZ1_9PLAT|nr:unnamed protein product [Protopolystoma xenopodis]
MRSSNQPSEFAAGLDKLVWFYSWLEEKIYESMSAEFENGLCTLDRTSSEEEENCSPEAETWSQLRRLSRYLNHSGVGFRTSFYTRSQPDCCYLPANKGISTHCSCTPSSVQGLLYALRPTLMSANTDRRGPLKSDLFLARFLIRVALSLLSRIAYCIRYIDLWYSSAIRDLLILHSPLK